MRCEYLNESLIRAFPEQAFRSAKPFPWFHCHEFLTASGFQRLHDDFPDLGLFESHDGMPRPHGQRSHDRFYLAYEANLYHEAGAAGGEGVVRHEELPKSWQQFADEIRGYEPYLALIRSLLGASAFRIRFAWHLGFKGSEVSPHTDSLNKLGTHIFFFNRSDAWDRAWGGSTLVLGGKVGGGKSPGFDAFSTADVVDILDNSSFLFKNTPQAWHGVEALSAPEGHYRRLFNVVFESEPGEKPPGPWERARRALRRLGR